MGGECRYLIGIGASNAIAAVLRWLSSRVSLNAGLKARATVYVSVRSCCCHPRQPLMHPGPPPVRATGADGSRQEPLSGVLPAACPPAALPLCTPAPIPIPSGPRYLHRATCSYPQPTHPKRTRTHGRASTARSCGLVVQRAAQLDFGSVSARTSSATGSDDVTAVPVGRLAELMSESAEAVATYFDRCVVIAVLPLDVAGALTILYFMVGAAGFGGLAVLLLVLLVSRLSGKRLEAELRSKAAAAGGFNSALGEGASGCRGALARLAPVPRVPGTAPAFPCAIRSAACAPCGGRLLTLLLRPPSPSPRPGSQC